MEEPEFKVHSIAFEESGLVIRYIEEEGVVGNFIMTNEVYIPYNVGITDDEQLKYWFGEALQGIEELVGHVQMYMRKAQTSLRSVR
jgi:hypothetical protein